MNRSVVTAVVAVGVLAGCGAGGAESTGSPGVAPTTGPPPTVVSSPPAGVPSPRPSVSPSPRVTPTPAPKAPVPTPRDGANLRACRDGRCQVWVKPRTTVRFSGGRIVIGKIDKFAHFTLSGGYGGGSGQLGPNCAVTFGYGGLTSRCGGTKPAPRTQDPPGLTLRVPYVRPGAAVLDLNRR